GLLRFDGSAKGDALEHIRVKGTFDPATGHLTLTEGELTRLEISDTLRRMLPLEWREALLKPGLSAGELDLALDQLDYDPSAHPQVHYSLAARLRGGVVNCPRLPFPLNDVSATLLVSDGLVTVQRAEGYNGKTSVRARRGGTLELGDLGQGRMRLVLDVNDLEFDDRLRAWTPPGLASLWDEYQPKGRLSLVLTLLRTVPGAPPRVGVGLDCRDVALTYRYFPYPVEHVHGPFTWDGQQIRLNLETVIGEKPFSARGTIENPGPGAVVNLAFEAGALPVDKVLFEALPPDVRKVVDQFKPTGSVRGRALLKRTPPGPGDPEFGKVTVDAYLDLNERCAITWEGLPYRITDLTGHLELHPDHWLFTNMKGGNGLALIEGEGSVRRVGQGDFKTELHLWGKRLPFDDQLRLALPQTWQNTWAILQPAGSTTFDAHILVEQSKENYHLVIQPERETRVKLNLPRVPGPGVAPGETFDMPPMEQVTGKFIFDNGTVTMTDVGFQFRGSPARFERGAVNVRDTGQFRLDVQGLEVADFRVDRGLCRIMPPLMAQFARRLDDGKTFRFHTNLAIGWSGKPGQSAWCAWSDALVVLNDNTIHTGLPLEHLQGQLDHLRGVFDGQNLEVHGALSLDSISLLGQQVTFLSSPLDVVHNRATLSNLKGELLGGELLGSAEVDLESTPRYTAHLSVRGADLERYTKTVYGRQNLRGLVESRIVLSGLGSDLHTLQGQGEVHITEGDLGELPALIRLVKFLNLSPLTRTAFDSADASFRIRNGETLFDPIKFTGNAFSLRGSGTMSAQGELNLGLRVLYGRDEGMHIPVVSDALRETTGQIFQIEVKGSPAFPRFHPVALQPIRALGSRRGARSGME
ncbi:MAG TPA: AsmA-like C-terminal region-containing protein, partial [Isosphaeraceae bacterium]|nr:AsmA-like C-terminal region-containing protein [Isosphaeraceae bacterium]